MSLERYQPKNNVSQLDNRPKLTADDLKKEFDKAENNIGEFINNKLIPSIETELDNKSIKIVTITGLEVTTQGGNGGVLTEGNAISSMTAKKIYDAYSVGKTIVAHIPSLGTAAIVSEVSEIQCKFTAMSGNSVLDKYTFVINDEEAEKCRFYSCRFDTFIFDSLDGDSTAEALSANQGRILNENTQRHVENKNNPHEVTGDQIKICVGVEDPLFGEDTTVEQALNKLYDDNAKTANKISDLSANKIEDDSDTESPEGTVGARLFELSEGLSGVQQALDGCEITWNKTYEIDSDSTHGTYPSAKAVWDALQNFDVSDFIELNLYDYRDFDSYNHRTIEHNGACNVMYRGTMGGSVPYIMSIQIAYKDIPRTYQTVLYSGVCKKRWYGDEWGNDGSNEKWSEWEDVGGSDTPNILNSKIGYVDEIDTYQGNGELYYITTKITYYGFNPYYLFVFSNGQEYTQIRLDGGGIYKRKYQYFEGMADENSGAIIPEGWRWSDWVGIVDFSDLRFDSRPTEGSSNFITSGAVFDSLGDTAEALEHIIEIQEHLMGVSE